MACTGPRLAWMDAADAASLYERERARRAKKREGDSARAIRETLRDHADLLLDDKARARLRNTGSAVPRDPAHIKARARRGASKDRKVSVEDIRRAVALSASWREVARRLGIGYGTLLKYRAEGYISDNIAPSQDRVRMAVDRLIPELREKAPEAQSWRHLAVLCGMNHMTLGNWRRAGLVPPDIAPAGRS
jgi:hypothetical protein